MEPRLDQQLRLPQRGEPAATGSVEWRGTTHDYDPRQPNVILSAVDHSRFSPGEIIYLPNLREERCGSDSGRICILKIAPDGTCADRLYPLWKRDQHFTSVAGLIKSFGKSLGIDGHIDGRMLRFTLGGAPLPQEEAINRLVEAYMLSTLPEELRAEHSRTSLGKPSAAKARSERGHLYVVNDAHDLREVLTPWVGIDPPEPWLQNWHERFINSGKDDVLEREPYRGGGALWLYHVDGKFVIGAHERFAELETLRCEPDQRAPAACDCAIASVPIHPTNGLAVLDFAGVLAKMGLDPYRAACRVAGELKDLPNEALLGEHGQYSVNFFVDASAEEGAKRSAEVRYRLSDQRVIIPNLSGKPKITVAVKRLGDSDSKLAITRGQCEEMLQLCNRFAAAMSDGHRPDVDLASAKI